MFARMAGSNNARTANLTLMQRRGDECVGAFSEHGAIEGVHYGVRVLRAKQQQAPIQQESRSADNAARASLTFA